jgi:hypothetical protein
MLLSALSAQDRRHRGVTQSLRARLLTVPDLLVLLGLLLQAPDQCVVACRPRQRLITSHPVLIMLLHRSSPHIPHSLFKRRHPLPSFTRYLTSHPTAFRIPTTAHSQAVFLHLPHLHLPVLGVLLPKARLKVTQGLADVLLAHPQRCDRSSRTVQVLPATVTKGRISTILILLQVAASPAALLRQHLLWWLLKLLHATEVTTVPLLHHRRGIASGKTMIMSTPSRLPTMRSVRSSRSHTAVGQLLPTRCHHPRLRVTVRTARQMLEDSTMATTHLKLLTTHRRFLQWEQHHRHPACQRPLNRNVLSNTSRPHARWRSMRIMMMNQKTRRRMPQRLSEVARATPPPQTALHNSQHQLSRSHRKTSYTGPNFVLSLSLSRRADGWFPENGLICT